MVSNRKKLKAKPSKRTKSRDTEMAKINKYLDSIKLPKKITKHKMSKISDKLEKTQKNKRKSPKKSKKKISDVGMKIKKLMKEGYPHKQAVAIALSMKKSNKLGPHGGYKKSKKRKSPKKSESKRKSPKKSESKRKSPKKSKSERKSPKKSKSERKSPKKSKSERKSPKKSKSEHKSPKKSGSKTKKCAKYSLCACPPVRCMVKKPCRKITKCPRR
jgi:hypothetical protein